VSGVGVAVFGVKVLFRGDGFFMIFVCFNVGTSMVIDAGQNLFVS
jgi:hypothetical protein